jgi:hypothetical protein
MMENRAKKRIYLAVLSLLMIAIYGCGGGAYRSARDTAHQSYQQDYSSRQEFQRHQPQTPSHIDILITIREWMIVQHRILSDTDMLGDIRFAGRFLFLDDLVFKLKAERTPDWYWLVKIPSVEEGIYEIRARCYREYSQDLKPVEAPERVEVSLRIVNQIITEHYMVDPNPGWGNFQVAGYRAPVLYFKNEQYPGRVWAAKLPRQNGTWTIYVTLIR